MPIDWFTVAAQILNFIVLVWILKRFLYLPILKTMDERQKRVEESMLASVREKEVAAKERAAFQEKSENLDRDRDAILATAAREMKAERTQVVAGAREEFQSLRERWRETLRREQDELKEELANRVQSEALAMASQLVRDLADADLQERLARKFIRKIEEMPIEERQALVGPLDESDGSESILSTAFEVNDGLREEIERAVRSVIGRQTPLRFETKASLGIGIELAVNGRKASWTIDNYLGSLETSVQELIERETGLANEQPKQG